LINHKQAELIDTQAAMELLREQDKARFAENKKFKVLSFFLSATLAQRVTPKAM